MCAEHVAWERMTWAAGAERYTFEVRDQGLIGELSVSDGRSFALPMVVWEAMLDAVKCHRKARGRSDANLPPRAGARWTAAESDEMAAKFLSGRSPADLAREHARTLYAIEGQLAKLGLWDRIERRATGRTTLGGEPEARTFSGTDNRSQQPAPAGRQAPFSTS